MKKMLAFWLWLWIFFQEEIGLSFHGLHCAKENVGKVWVGKKLVVKYSLRIFTVHFGDTMMGKMWSYISESSLYHPQTC